MIKINIFSDCLHIMVSALSHTAKVRLIGVCLREKCTIESQDRYRLKVIGSKSQLFNLLYVLTYDYEILLE